MQNPDELNQEFERIRNSLRLEEKRVELKKCEALSSDPNFWGDLNKARSVMQKIGDLKNELESVKEVENVLKDAKSAEELGMSKELGEYIKKAESLIKKLKLVTYLSHKYDKRNAIITIHAGQGGVEAMDWVSMLFRMYLRYFEKKEWVAEVLEQTDAEEAGIKSVTIRVCGLYVYGYLKNEAGTHRLVRQSPFNADKLRQTSFALVEVLPEFEQVDTPDIEIQDDEIEWQFFRSSGHGGQNVNKVSTAVRLKHVPSGVTVSSQTQRSQQQNRENALALLRAKLWAKAQEETVKEKSNVRGEYVPATWGTQIRSYVLHPYKMIKDLRTGYETGDTEFVLNGGLDEFVEAELKLGVD